MEGREGSEGQSQRRTGKEGVEQGKGGYGPLAKKGGVPEFLVTPLIMGLFCLLSQGRFDEPVRP